MRKSDLIAFVFGAFVLALLASCGFEPAPLAAHERRFRLTWDNDADLELELWRATADGETLVARSHELAASGLSRGARGGIDEVSGKGGRSEEIVFRHPGGATPGGDTVYYIAVSFWSVGPTADTLVAARVTVEEPFGFREDLTGELNDDRYDLWFTYRIDQENNVTKVDRYRFQGL